MSILVRNALDSDRDALIGLSRRTISASYRTFLGDQVVDAFLGSGAADRYVEENIGRCSVIERDGELVGLAVCQENLIDLMMIDKTAHRQGLGRTLLRHVEARLFESYGELRLESFEDNENANAFYRRNGWLQVSRNFDEVSEAHKIVFVRRKG